MTIAHERVVTLLRELGEILDANIGLDDTGVLLLQFDRDIVFTLEHRDDNPFLLFHVSVGMLSSGESGAALTRMLEINHFALHVPLTWLAISQHDMRALVLCGARALDALTGDSLAALIISVGDEVERLRDIFIRNDPEIRSGQEASVSSLHLRHFIRG